jgi:hypothetical protein
MSTLYDLVTMVVFAGLVVLFLQRSTEPETPHDRIYHYLPPSLGCAVANYLGNQHVDAAAVPLIIGVVIYILLVLKPFTKRS